MAGFVFASGEALDRAFCRVMRRQLRSAGRALSSEEAPALAVHRARRCLKRSRALIALLEPAFRKNRWAKEAKALKRAGQQLSGARDEQAKLDALDKLAMRNRGKIGATTINMLRKTIEARRAKRERAVAREHTSDLARDFDRLAKRFGRKRLERFDGSALLDGIAETYRCGRRAMRRAYESGHDEDFHAWRREVQTHWRHMQLIEACAATEARPRADAAKALSGLLGEDHDLWLLLSDLDRRSLPLGAAARQRLKRANRRGAGGVAARGASDRRAAVCRETKAACEAAADAWRDDSDGSDAPKMPTATTARRRAASVKALVAA